MADGGWPALQNNKLGTPTQGQRLRPLLLLHVRIVDLVPLDYHKSHRQLALSHSCISTYIHTYIIIA